MTVRTSQAHCAGRCRAPFVTPQRARSNALCEDCQAAEDTADTLGRCGRCGHLHTEGPDTWCPEQLAVYDAYGNAEPAACGCPEHEAPLPPACRHCRRTPRPGENHGLAVRYDADDDAELVCIGTDRHALTPMPGDPWTVPGQPEPPPPF